jgi:hypothetical protein
MTVGGVLHYSRKLLCRRPEAVGLGLECRRLSLIRRLFSDAVGLAAVCVTGRRVRAKCRRVTLVENGPLAWTL